jgi:hypothetical protein
MAALTVTPDALDCIRPIIEREEIRSPLVAVAWSPGLADLNRGTAGEAVWVRGWSGWLATLLDLAEVEAAAGSWAGPILEMHGSSFPFLKGRHLHSLKVARWRAKVGGWWFMKPPLDMSINTDPQRRPAWPHFFNAECAVAAQSRSTLGHKSQPV